VTFVTFDLLLKNCSVAIHNAIFKIAILPTTDNMAVTLVKLKLAN